MKRNLHAPIVLTLIFFVSVIIRIPNINRPLSKHHEFVTAISLRVLQIWDMEGAGKFHYVPVMNYPGKANKFINNHASPTRQMIDAEGNFYYVSHPPLAYILPHAVFSIFHVKPTVLALQIFHLFINFMSAIAVYLIVLALKNVHARSELDGTALIAFTLYTFSTAVLWFQCNTYMSDMLVHLFFLMGILTTIQCIKNPTSYRWKLFFALNLFLMIYTSWLGIFFATVVFIIAISKWRKCGGIVIAVYTILASVLALMLILFQYSSISGMSTFIAQLTQRFSVRGIDSIQSNGGFLMNKLNEIFLVCFNYGVNYLPLLLFIALALSFNRKHSFLLFKEQMLLFTLSVVPILLLHLILLNYSGHDFTVLYASCFLSIITAMLIEKAQKVNKWLLTSALVVLSVGIYFYINRPGMNSWNGDCYNASMLFGERIKHEANDDEVVIVLTDYLDPMVVVYAQRNIVQLEKMDQIEPYLREMNLNRYRIFKMKKEID